jgi:predicted dehydrogenase
MSRPVALSATFQPGREVHDAGEAAVAFEKGAVGTSEATRFATGRKNALQWEINGSNGSLAFDLERLNELRYSDGGTPALATGALAGRERWRDTLR